MKNFFCNNDSGSILMEYVILIMMIGAPLLVVMQAGFYDFQDGVATGTGVLNVFGIEVEVTTPAIMFKHYFQRILTGIALPIP